MNWNKVNSSLPINGSHLQYSNQTRDSPDTQLQTAIHYIFCSIAALSFLSNFLLCLVMRRRRKLLSKTYNILMFNLAITDMLTGIFLVATPDYVTDRKSFPYPSGLAGKIYCRLIGSTYILFIFGKASNLTIMCLAIDRWYSIVKPIRYKITFSKRRLYLYITLIWASAVITQINELFITTVEDGLCTFKTPFYGQMVERFLILAHVIITFYIPSVVTWVTFGHIWMHIRQPNIRRHADNNKTTTRLLRMCALAAFFLTISWFPTETFFVLFKFDVLKLPFKVNLLTSILAMSNSCVNPWIYCLSNMEYRREFVQLLCCIKVNLGCPRVSRLSFGMVTKRRSRYSFPANACQTNLNDNLAACPNVLSLSEMPYNLSSVSLTNIAFSSSNLCSEAVQMEEVTCSPKVPSGDIENIQQFSVVSLQSSAIPRQKFFQLDSP